MQSGIGGAKAGAKAGAERAVDLKKGLYMTTLVTRGDAGLEAGPPLRDAITYRSG